jgi:hypothetical protein
MGVGTKGVSGSRRQGWEQDQSHHRYHQFLHLFFLLNVCNDLSASARYRESLHPDITSCVPKLAMRED